MVSLARTAGVTGLSSKDSSLEVRISLVLADISTMSTRPCAVISSICSRYSPRLRKRGLSVPFAGDIPVAPIPRAMSASLASARMKSFAPKGSA